MPLHVMMDARLRDDDIEPLRRIRLINLPSIPSCNVNVTRIVDVRISDRDAIGL